MTEETEDINKFDMILEALREKASVKQQIYRNTQLIFSQLKNVTRKLSEDLKNQLGKLDPFVPIEFSEGGEFEFSARFSGDLLVFSMHSNVVTFSPDHILFGNPYIIEQPLRSYFGQILVYNFTADSVRYGRLNDQGYLLARFLVNLENHYFIESVGQLNFQYPDISRNLVSDAVLLEFVESNVLTAIETDLQAAPYTDLQVITLGEKEANKMPGAIEKVGFQMKYQQQDNRE